MSQLKVKAPDRELIAEYEQRIAESTNPDELMKLIEGCRYDDRVGYEMCFITKAAMIRRVEISNPHVDVPVVPMVELACKIWDAANADEIAGCLMTAACNNQVRPKEMLKLTTEAKAKLAVEGWEIASLSL